MLCVVLVRRGVCERKKNFEGAEWNEHEPERYGFAIMCTNDSRLYRAQCLVGTLDTPIGNFC